LGHRGARNQGSGENYIVRSLMICTPQKKKNYSGDHIEKNEMGRTPSTCGENRGAYRVLVGKPEGKKPLGRPRRRWEDNAKLNLQKVGWRDGLNCCGSE
jgi:hypothetical protein